MYQLFRCQTFVAIAKHIIFFMIEKGLVKFILYIMTNDAFLKINFNFMFCATVTLIG